MCIRDSYITGKNGSAEQAAIKIEELTRVYTVGERHEVTITRVVPFGAFAKLDGQNEGLIHISEIVPWRLEKVDGVLEEGEKVNVVISKVEDGKIGLSIKQIDPDFGKNKGLIDPENN